MNRLVYIIVLNWNRKQDTVECIDSLKNIRYRESKILLVDNGSNDGSVAEIRSRFPEIEIVENRKNLRFAEGNNVGIRHALDKGADYVLLLNNDTIVDPIFLNEMVCVAESGDKIGMVGAKILYYDDPQRIWFAGGKIRFWRGITSHMGLNKLDSAKYDRIREVDYLTGSALLVKRALPEKIGMLDPSYYIYCEDADWCQRAKRVGYKLIYVPRARVWHKVSASSGGGLTAFKTYHKVKSNFLFFKRYARWYHWITIPVFIFWGALKFIITNIIKGNLNIISVLFVGFKDSIRPQYDQIW